MQLNELARIFKQVDKAGGKLVIGVLERNQGEYFVTGSYSGVTHVVSSQRNNTRIFKSLDTVNSSLSAVGICEFMFLASPRDTDINNPSKTTI